MTVRIVDGVPWVCERSFPWAFKVENYDHDLSGPWPYKRRAFGLKFESGWTLSIIWGSGTYSTNRHWEETGNFVEEVEAVEIAAWPAGGDMVEWDDGDTVRGWVPADRLLLLIDEMMSWPSTVPECFVARVPEGAR